MDREKIDRYLAQLGFSGSDKDIVGDMVELYRGQAMKKLYTEIGRKHAMTGGWAGTRIRQAVIKAWKKSTPEMQRVCTVACKAPRNRWIIEIVRERVQQKNRRLRLFLSGAACFSMVLHKKGGFPKKRLQSMRAITV